MPDGDGVTRLLQADPDLGIGLDDAARREAEERLIVPVVSLDRAQREGPWALDSGHRVLGFMLVEGCFSVN